jgi:hypothetical protein
MLLIPILDSHTHCHTGARVGNRTELSDATARSALYFPYINFVRSQQCQCQS